MAVPVDAALPGVTEDEAAGATGETVTTRRNQANGTRNKHCTFMSDLSYFQKYLNERSV